ncbi:hypothetical protein [Streptomyces sp. Wb2n-11]|uniref:hypothetical protein n=1 Tax=Streptomyces sp. Wb2n-11 TaxID=1030533 RepID=UPI000AECCC14|nr:hypothetical protein [Streptomyces sp. Wb2n-11]
MPRPTAAQFAYGSATVVFSTLAMLLLSRTASGIGAAVIALAALALGVLVALTAPGLRTVRTAPRTSDATSAPASPSTEAASGTVDHASRAHSAVGGPSLRG